MKVSAALFTIIVVTDKPVAFPRRLIISRRKRKGLLRPGATLTSTPLFPHIPACVSTYVLSRTPETRYYWITFLIRPLSAASAATHSLSNSPPSSPTPLCPTSSQVGTTLRRILYFRIPNGITMQEISFVIYARYKRAHFRLG